MSTFSLDTDRTSYQLALKLGAERLRNRPVIGEGRGVDQCL